MTPFILKEKISQTLETLIVQSTSILETNNQIPQIDIDVTLSHIRVLYQTFLDLDKANKIVETPVISSNQTINKEPVVQEKITETVIQAQEPIVIDNISPVISTPIEKIIEEIKPEPKVAEPIETKAPPVNADLFSDTETPLPKKIPAEPKKLIFEQVTQTKISDKIMKPIASIKQAIGINERYQFMNLLFKGNHDEYADIINRLDTCNEVANAYLIIEDITSKFQWKEDIELETLAKLNDLIARRFASL